MTSRAYALDPTWRALLVDLGVAPARVLRRAGLPADLLQRPSARVSSADFYRFWHGLEQEAADPLLPLRLCQAIRGESLSPPLHAALCSPDLVVAARRLARYKRLVAPVRLDVDERPGALDLRLTWLDAPLTPPATLVTAELLFFVGLARLGTRQPVRPRAISMRVPPRLPAPYEAFLGVGIRRGPHRVTFSRDDAISPFLTASDAMWAALEPGFRQRLAALDDAGSAQARLRAALVELLPGGPGSLPRVAQALATSARTLQRQLAAERTTYQRALDRTRAELARHYLRRTELPAAEIAFLLGFDEPNSFYRAFRGWTGMTPAGVRRRAAAARRRAGR
jgi:AraC-like DNA-binding protein